MSLNYKGLPSGNYRADLGLIGVLIQLPLLLIFLILFIFIQIIKKVFSYNIAIFPGYGRTGRILTDRERFRDRMDYHKKKYPPAKEKRQTTWEDLTEKQQQMVMFVRASTAKAKRDWK